MRTLKESSHCSHNYISIYKGTHARVHYYIYKKKVSKMNYPPSILIVFNFYAFVPLVFTNAPSPVNSMLIVQTEPLSALKLQLVQYA